MYLLDFSVLLVAQKINAVFFYNLLFLEISCSLKHVSRGPVGPKLKNRFWELHPQHLLMREKLRIISIFYAKMVGAQSA